MINSDNKDLILLVHRHMRQIRNMQLKSRLRWEDYYPAVSVGCEYNVYSAVGDHHSKSYKYQFHDNVYSELKKLGRLNELVDNATKTKYNISIECKNFIGHCAENYAATKVLREIEGNNQCVPYVKDLSFTIAFQPRSGIMKPWCDNCKHVFG